MADEIETCGSVAEFAGNEYVCTREPHTGMVMHRDDNANGGAGQEWPKIDGSAMTGDAPVTDEVADGGLPE